MKGSEILPHVEIWAYLIDAYLHCTLEQDMGKNSSLEEPNPHFANLHCDDRLSLSLVYPFEVGSTLIGKKDEVSPPKIEFNGLGLCACVDFESSCIHTVSV